MKSRRIATAIALTLASVGAYAADSYCLRNICIGDPVANYQKRFGIQPEEIARNPNPYCGEATVAPSREVTEGDIKYVITYWPNPAKAGESTGRYYEIVGVGVYFAPVSMSELISTAQPVAAKMKLKALPNRATPTWGNDKARLGVVLQKFGDAQNLSGLTLSKQRPLNEKQLFEAQAGCRGGAPKF